MAVDQARRAVDLAPASEPERVVVYKRRWSALLRRANQPAEALAVLRGLTPPQQFEPGVMDDLAACWALLGQPERAAEHYESALLLDPANPVAAASAAHWHLEANQPERAERMIQRLRRLSPHSPKL